MNPNPIKLEDIRKGDTVMFGPHRLTAIEHAQPRLPMADSDKPDAVKDPGGFGCRFTNSQGRPFTIEEKNGLPPVELYLAPKLNDQLDPYAMIRTERKEQVGMGFDALHDGSHDRGEIALGAAMFAIPPETRNDSSAVKRLWPWREDQFHPSDDRIHELVKAGAMIVAEIERLQRVNEKARIVLASASTPNV